MVSGLLSSDCAARLRGFADSTSVCWQRTGRNPLRPPPDRVRGRLCGPFLRPAATAYGARLARILRARAKSKCNSQSQSPSSACGTFSRCAGEGRSRAEAKRHLQACGNLLRFGCAGGAVNGAPMQWRSGGDKARRACPGLDPGVARRDASQLAASPGMDCQPTPEPLRGVAGQDARRPLHRGGLSLGYFSLATQREVTRSPKASESFASKGQAERRATLHEEEKKQSHWVPARTKSGQS